MQMKSSGSILRSLAYLYIELERYFCSLSAVFKCIWIDKLDHYSIHSETPPGENQNVVVSLTVRIYVWIGPNWPLKQTKTKSTKRQVQEIAYQSKL